MTDAPQNMPKPAPASTVDPRVNELSFAGDCDINTMKAALELLYKDRSVFSLLNQVRSPGELNIDFDGDKNIKGAPTNREWASALIAVAQLTREQGLPAEKLKVEDIKERGQCVFDIIDKMEKGEIPPICKVSTEPLKSR